MKNTVKNLFQSAQDNWPEDEAFLTFSTFRDRLADCASDESERVYNREAFARDVAHMTRVFMRESDGPELVSRYRAELSKLLLTDSATEKESLPSV